MMKIRAKRLTETVDKLHRQAGMTDIEGPGIIIEVRPSRRKYCVWYADYWYFSRSSYSFCE